MRTRVIIRFICRGIKNTALIGSELPYELDITEIDGFDDLHHSEGYSKELQEYAACCIMR